MEPVLIADRKRGESKPSPQRATGIAGALFAEDYERNWARLLAWNTPELRGDAYVIDEDVAKFAAEPATSGA